MYDMFLFNAAGDGVTDDTPALQAMLAVACDWAKAVNTNATATVNAGSTFLAFPVQVNGPCGKGLRVVIDGDIIAPLDYRTFPPPPSRSYDTWANLVFLDVPNLTIEGKGTVDGRGYGSWWDKGGGNRPLNLLATRCNNFRLTGVTLLNPGKQSLKIRASLYVYIADVNITSGTPESPNTDCSGFSSVSHAIFENSYVECGDDNVAIIGRSSNITVRNLVGRHGHGISIGSLGGLGTTACVTDIFVKNITLIDTDNGVRIKSYQGGFGLVKNVNFEDVTMVRVEHPIVIDQYYCDMSESLCGAQNTAVAIKDVTFRNIVGTASSVDGIELMCSSTVPCTGLVLDNINITPTRASRILRVSIFEAFGEATKVLAPNIAGKGFNDGVPTFSQAMNIISSTLNQCGDPGPWSIPPFPPMPPPSPPAPPPPSPPPKSPPSPPKSPPNQPPPSPLLVGMPPPDLLRKQ